MLNLSGVKLTPEETHSQVTLITLYSEPMVIYFQLNNSQLSTQVTIATCYKTKKFSLYQLRLYIRMSAISYIYIHTAELKWYYFVPRCLV